MNILLIEDFENKRDQIVGFLEEHFSGASVSTAKSVQSGLKEILKKPPDLILLDMTMPTFDIGTHEDGGRPQPLGGREILRQMDRRGVTIPVIVVTQFDKFGDGPDALTIEELDSQLSDAHARTYIGSVYYNPALEGWREELSDLIVRLERNDLKP